MLDLMERKTQGMEWAGLTEFKKREAEEVIQQWVLRLKGKCKTKIEAQN